MFEGSVQIESGSVTGVSAVVGAVAPAHDREGQRSTWRELDRQLRTVARRRGALDHEELALIREAIACALWRELGMISMREYLEHVMGYGPTAASERLRVADALAAMPALEEALASGELSYSAVRAITRIATRKTERAWLAACRGKNVKQIEELLAEREPGDRPESPRKPDLRLQDVRMKLSPHVIAMMRQARMTLEGEMGERVDENTLMETALAAFLRGSRPATRASSNRGSEPSPQVRSGEADEQAANAGPHGETADEVAREERCARRVAPYQIAISVCSSCKIARQNGAGVEFAISPAAFERAACDARWLGNLDGERARAAQSVTPATRERVLARDRHRCRIPGCRSARNLEVHHIEHQEHGGSHDENNLVTICGGHHASHHDGTLIIRGTATELEVSWTHEVAAHEAVEAATSHVESAMEKRSKVAALRADATSALTNLGYRKDVSARAVREAIELDGFGDLETVIRGALKRAAAS